MNPLTRRGDMSSYVVWLIAAILLIGLVAFFILTKVTNYLHGAA